MRKYRAILVALLAPLLLALPVAVRAQTSDAVGLEIQPAQTETDLSGRSFSTTLTLFNHDPTTYKVSLSLQALGHDLDGAPQYLPSTIVTEAFSLSATNFSLSQGQKKSVKLSGSIPASLRSIYFGVLAEYKSTDEQAGQSVETRTRIASQFLLRAPKPWVERVRVTDVGATPGPGKKVTLYAIVKNTGNVHVRPRGTITVKRDDNTIASFPFMLNAAGKPGAIIPDFARRLTALWRAPSELTGKFTVTATIANPAATATKTVEFSRGAALAPDAKIDNLSATPRGGLTVDIDIKNQGGAPLTGAKLRLIATQDGRFERGQQVFPIDTLKPGAVVEKRWTLPGVPDGAYRITATLELGTALLDQRVAGVRVGAEPGKSRSILLIIAAILLFVIVGLIIWFLLKRRQRDEPAPGTA